MLKGLIEWFSWTVLAWVVGVAAGFPLIILVIPGLMLFGLHRLGKHLEERT